LRFLIEFTEGRLIAGFGWMGNMERNRRGKEGRGPMEMEQIAEFLRENQKLITLGRLTASIAHEINNPLESVTNLLYLMGQECSEKTAEYLELAQRELSRVVQITRQSLTFSRETSAPSHVQLSELIDEVLGLHSRRISDKGLRIVRQYQANDPVSVLPGEIRQVLSNLISNAIEATAPRGRIVIRIRPSRRWSEHGRRGLRLSIGDNGSGIPEDIRSRLGEPFFTTKGQGGTGLGLWVTQSILSRYGSDLQLRSSVSSERHGTVFSVFLPFNQRSFAVVPGGGEMEKFPQTGTRGPRWRGLRLIQQDAAADQIAGSEPGRAYRTDPSIDETDGSLKNRRRANRE
jgi:two-component system, NtrC family, sensor kinase